MAISTECLAQSFEISAKLQGYRTCNRGIPRVAVSAAAAFVIGNENFPDSTVAKTAVRGYVRQPGDLEFKTFAGAPVRQIIAMWRGPDYSGHCWSEAQTMKVKVHWPRLRRDARRGFFCGEGRGSSRGVRLSRRFDLSDGQPIKDAVEDI